MHTSRYEIHDQEVIVIHNGDWSGDALVRFVDENGLPVEARLPGLFLLKLGKASAIEALRFKIIGAVETALYADDPPSKKVDIVSWAAGEAAKMTESAYRDLCWRNVHRPADVDGQIEAVREEWVSGNRARGEIDDLYFDVMVFEGFPLEKIPEGFRARVQEHLEAWATAPADTNGVRFMGGVYTYEVEPDPIKKAAMKAEVEVQHAVEAVFYDRHVRPRIRAWWAARGGS